MTGHFISNSVAGFVPSWRTCAAFTGGLYFGIAGLMHLIKRPATPNEWIALVSDWLIFIVIASGVIHRVAATVP